jgi:hypothetical protein
MTLRFGELVLIRMQLHQTTGAKVRPALVLLDPGDDDFIAAPITSQGQAFGLRSCDGRLASGGTKCSVVYPDPQVDIVRRLGLLPERDR